MAFQDRNRSDSRVPGAIDAKWAWARYEPDEQRPWNLAWTGHLYRRAGFGATWRQLQEGLTDGPQKTVDRLLNPAGNIEEFNRRYDGFDDASADSIEGLRAWWLRRMIETRWPLLEKMCLFWHGHFATGILGVKNPKLMLDYVRLLRMNALGSFSVMLKGISKDPAVMLWLGAEHGPKTVLNEDYARALLEHFTLGPDDYSDKDVREAARAFTGWFVLRGKRCYIEREHDTGRKTFLGRTGTFTDTDIVRILLEQRATAEKVVAELYRWLITESNEPAPGLMAPLLETFSRDYNIRRLVETMLRSNLFFSPTAYRRRIKCPVEFALGIVRPLESVVSTTQLAQDIAGLGQSLLDPPTVAGWMGGRRWIDSTAITGRNNLVLSLLRGSGPYGNNLNPGAVAEDYGATDPESTARLLAELFLQEGDTRMNLLEAGGEGDNGSKARRIAHALLTLPEFNLA